MAGRLDIGTGTRLALDIVIPFDRVPVEANLAPLTETKTKYDQVDKRKEVTVYCIKDRKCHRLSVL